MLQSSVVTVTPPPDVRRRTVGQYAAWAAVLFLLSIVLLATQQYNPFIYFLF